MCTLMNQTLSFDLKTAAFKGGTELLTPKPTSDTKYTLQLSSRILHPFADTGVERLPAVVTKGGSRSTLSQTVIIVEQWT